VDFRQIVLIQRHSRGGGIRAVQHGDRLARDHGFLIRRDHEHAHARALC